VVLDYCVDYFGDNAYYGWNVADSFDDPNTWKGATNDNLFFETYDPDWGYECMEMQSTHDNTNLAFRDYLSAGGLADQRYTNMFIKIPGVDPVKC
jgi:hypothetical protein